MQQGNVQAALLDERGGSLTDLDTVEKREDLSVFRYVFNLPKIFA